LPDSLLFNLNDLLQENMSFYCKTTDGGVLKSLFEIIYKSIKTNACFEITNDGIFFNMLDTTTGKFSLCAELKADAFNIFQLNTPSSTLVLGLNILHVYEMMKSVSKKDIVILEIKADNPGILLIHMISKDQSRKMTSSVVIQEIHNLDMEYPEISKPGVIIPSLDFKKMIKDILALKGSSIRVKSSATTVSFSSEIDSIYDRETTFGNDLDNKETVEDVSQEYDPFQFSRLAKVATLSNKIHVYQEADCPLIIKTNIGDLGELRVYIRTRDMDPI
jgi:hypothetical protein